MPEKYNQGIGAIQRTSHRMIFISPRVIFLFYTAKLYYGSFACTPASRAARLIISNHHCSFITSASLRAQTSDQDKPDPSVRSAPETTFSAWIYIYPVESLYFPYISCFVTVDLCHQFVLVEHKLPPERSRLVHPLVPCNRFPQWKSGWMFVFVH